MKINLKTHQIVALAIFFLFSNSLIAQNSVSGKIVDNQGLPLPGATILEKGTTNGAQSDFNGEFLLQGLNKNATLVISYLGYSSQEIFYTGQNNIIITLEENIADLDEIVVIGYGTTKKSDITGSVSSVKSEELNAFPVLNAAQALQGRAAGVAVKSNNGGEPGAPIAINIRGNTSIGASSAALVVVDGFVGAHLPQATDIESIEILKDASATAIYGSRGANGVILVTTKKGRAGKMVVELNSSYSMQEVTKRLDLLNASQFADYRQAINPAYQPGPVETDWQDLIYRSGNTSNHQLSFSGGTDLINYYVSGNYFDQKGVVINSGFERFSFLGNIDVQANDRLKLGFSAYGNRGEKNGIPTQANTGGASAGDVISIAYRFAPDRPVQNPDGSNTQNPLGDAIDNPYAIATEVVDNQKTDNYRANAYGELELLKGLKFKSTLGFETLNRISGNFKPSTLLSTAGGQGGIAELETVKSTDIITENYLTYNKDFGKSDLTLLAGYSFQKTKNERFGAESQNFVSNSLSYWNLGAGSNVQNPYSGLTEQVIISQYARLNYNFDDRYLLTLTARRDGASNFAENEKYAFFPSGAVAWNISNEKFLEDNNAISNLKLRASYGVTGNPSISPYQSLATFRTRYANVGDVTVNSIAPLQLANPNLKWESSYQTNYGVDLGLLNNRINLSVDVYNIDTEDLILGDSSAPEYFGLANPTALRNIGEINNKGVEISLNTRNIVTEKFSWSTDLNWSKNENTVVKLIDGQDIFLNAIPGSFLQGQSHVLREGEPVGVFYGYEYQGVYQGGDFPEGLAGYSGAEAGDELFTDINGDGKITGQDRKIIGDPNPDWIAGINNNLRYGNFDLNIFFQASVGGEIFSSTFLELASGESNATTEVLNAWTPTNTNTNVPSAGVREKRVSSRFVYDGGYVRLKNLALGYNLPEEAVGKLGMQGVRLALSAQNLLTFTDFPGTDPEASYRSGGNQNSNVNRGFDYGSYPNIRSLTLSVNLKF